MEWQIEIKIYFNSDFVIYSSYILINEKYNFKQINKYI